MTHIGSALDALGAALATTGVPRWEAPASSSVLDNLQAAVAPLRIPSEVLTFWEQVNVATLRIEPYPQLVAPEFALSSWQVDAALTPGPPPLLLVGYESHDCMSVELDVADVKGGPLFEWFLSLDTGFTRRHNSLSEWVSYVAELIEAGRYQRLQTSDGGPRLRVPHPQAFDDWDATRPVPADDQVHGERTHYLCDRADWPDHWQRRLST